MFGGEERYALPGETRRGRSWLIIGAVVLVIAIALAGVWFFLHSGNKDGAAAGGAKGAQSSQLPTVSVAMPGNASIVRNVSGTGSLAAKRDMPVGVAGEGGLITKVLVEPGTWVKSGQVLATVDRSVQVQTAESLAAQVRVAEADAVLAQSEVDRANSLVSSGFISKADLQRREATRDQSNARVRVAKAQLAETQARNGRLDIRAPTAGLVLTRTVEPGQIVSSGSGALFRMAMDGEMEMRAQLSEGDMQRVHVGDAAEVTPVGSTQVFHGKVWQVSPVIDAQTRQGTVRIQLAFDPALRPGGFASATIGAGVSNSPVLPQSAIQSDGKGNYVYVLDRQDKAERRGVTTGEVSDLGIAITSGLTGTERVVLTAGAFLNPGQKVIPKLTKLR
jgi:RND family efflux transporter MFP subunit